MTIEPLTSRPGGEAAQRKLLIAIAIVFVLKLVVYLLVIPAYSQQLGPLWGIGPADNYDVIADNIRRGFGYRFSPDTALTLMREPGYPYFLALLEWLFGAGLTAPIVANLVLSSGSALLISNLGRSISPLPWAPQLAALLFMLHPGVAVAELRSGVEIPFIFMLLCFFLALRRALHTERVCDYMFAGLILGLTSCVRSTALLFPPFLLLYHWGRQRSWRSLWQSLARIAATMIVAFLVLTPWIVRNYELVGKFIPTASVGGVALQVGNYICTHADGEKGFHQRDVEAAKVRRELASQLGYRFTGDYYQYFYDPHDEVSFNAELSRRVTEQYRHSPATFAKCAAENLVSFWFAGKTKTSTLLNVAVQLPYLVLGLVGLALGFRRADPALLACLLLFVVYSEAVYAPIHAQARYSVPMVPILALFAAIPLARLGERLFSKRRALASGAGIV
ncbi:MAG: glycosyltransferase family 39 protein [Steroidobacteraceae bacterium]